MPFPLAAIIAGAQILGPMLSRGGQGASSERTNQNNFAADQARLNLQAGQANNQNQLAAGAQNESALMNRSQLGMQAPSTRTRQALLGSLIQNARTARVTPPSGIRMGTVTGGLDLDTLLNAAARQAGGTLQRQATSALESGSDVPAFTDARAGLTPVSGSMQYQQPGRMESILSGGGILASLIGALGSAAQGNGASRPRMNLDEDI